MKLKRWLLWFIVPFYMMAGINHFLNPEFYTRLIPGYFPHPELITLSSGLTEITLGIMLLFSSTRKIAAMGIVIMLVCFLPVHIYFVQMNSCLSAEICVDPWVGWIRLVIGQPLLILWAWNVREF